MIKGERQLYFILSELYNKICSCRRDDPDREDLLNPALHDDGCLYKIAVERENIEWTDKEQTPDSSN
jgi:hypothetical protein